MIQIFNESFIIAICFVMFLYIIFRPVKKTINTSLENKIVVIKDIVKETEESKNEAQRLLKKLQNDMKIFDEKRERLLKTAAMLTEDLVDSRSQEMYSYMNRSRDLALKSIEDKKNKVGESMKSELIQSTLLNVHEYLTKTENNNVSDGEIMENLVINKDSKAS